MNKNEIQNEQVQLDLISCNNRIIEEATWLKEKCEMIIAKAKMQPKYVYDTHHFNSLVELQGNALSLDREIIAFEAKKKILSKVGKLPLEVKK